MYTNLSELYAVWQQDSEGSERVSEYSILRTVSQTAGLFEIPESAGDMSRLLVDRLARSPREAKKALRNAFKTKNVASLRGMLRSWKRTGAILSWGKVESPALYDAGLKNAVTAARGRMGILAKRTIEFKTCSNPHCRRLSNTCKQSRCSWCKSVIYWYVWRVVESSFIHLRTH